MALSGVVIATKSDMYGPSAGIDMRQSYLNANNSGSNGNMQSAPKQIPITQVFTGLKGSVLGQPLSWLFGLVLLLVAYKLIEEHRGGRESFEEIKIGLNNVVKIGLIAMLFFVIAKFLATRYSIPGASSFVLYATGNGS